MYTFDIIIIIIACLYTFFITIKILSLNKVNNEYQILQKDKPNANELIDILNQKLPTVITGEIEEWYIFDENDKIVPEKLNNKTLNDNSKRLCYPLPIVRKYEIQDFNTNFKSLVSTQYNTRNFLILLEGEISIFLINPKQKKEVKNNNNLEENSNLKFMEVKLYAEQVLHIPYGWHYSFKCHQNSKILELNSETLVTLPIKFIQDLKK